MSDYVVGDFVRCVDDKPLTWSDEQLVLGQEYTVRNVVAGITVEGGSVSWKRERFELVRHAGRDSESSDEVLRVIHPDMLDDGEVITIDGVRHRVSTTPIPSRTPENEWWDAPVQGVISLLTTTSPTVTDCRRWASQLGMELRVQVRRKAVS